MLADKLEQMGLVKRERSGDDARQTVVAAIVGGGFYFRIPEFPCAKPYAFAVDLEMSIEYCSTGVAVAVIAAFMLIRKIKADASFYRWIVRPLSEASYGTYLLHIPRRSLPDRPCQRPRPRQAPCRKGEDPHHRKVRPRGMMMTTYLPRPRRLRPLERVVNLRKDNKQ